MRNLRNRAARALCPRGFTLIEMMITVAIVAILAAVAFPAYTSHMAKGNRAEGRAAVMKMLMEQERVFTQRNTYVVVNEDGNAEPLKNFSGESRDRSKYFVGARACPGGLALTECVQVFAEPQFGSGDPDVGTLTATSTGPVKDCTGSKKQLCWP
jgi:type IV pilus assembly protein PilE